MEKIALFISIFLIAGTLLFILSQYVRFNLFHSISALFIAEIIFIPTISDLINGMEYFMLTSALIFPVLPGTAFHLRGFGPGRMLLRKRNNGKILLTFDDGPNPEFTPKITEILRAGGIRGIFFQVGRHIEETGNRIDPEAFSGMETGVHSMNHLPLPFLPSFMIRREIMDCKEAIKRFTGRDPAFFRPPWGLYNREVLETAEKAGLETVLWSRSGQDWKTADSNKIIQNATTGLRGGDILLLHDGCRKGKSRQATVEALPGILKAIREKGAEPERIHRQR